MKSAGPKDLTDINKIGTRPGKNTSIPSPAAAELGYSDILKSQKPQ